MQCIPKKAHKHTAYEASYWDRQIVQSFGNRLYSAHAFPPDSTDHKCNLSSSAFDTRKDGFIRMLVTSSFDVTYNLSFDILLLFTKHFLWAKQLVNQPWIFIGRSDAEAEATIFWPPDAKRWLIRKDFDAGKDWGQEKGTTEYWDGWVALSTQWTWVWASSGRWWRPGKPGMLQSTGSQRVRHDWATEQWQPWVDITYGQTNSQATGLDQQRRAGRGHLGGRNNSKRKAAVCSGDT